MARGYPDFGVVEETGKVLMPLEAADLSVRLGGITGYDKRGLVSLIDDFEAPVLKWRITVEDANSYARLDSTHVKDGSQAVRLHCHSDADDDARITRGIGLLKDTSIGIETSFRYSDIGSDFYFGLTYYSSTLIYTAEVKIDFNTATIYVYNSAGGYTEVVDYAAIFKNDFDFHTLKLVTDFATQKYIRVMFDSQEFAIPTVDIHGGFAAAQTMIFLYAHLGTKGVTEGDIWLENFILTHNEPP